MVTDVLLGKMPLENWMAVSEELLGHNGSLNIATNIVVVRTFLEHVGADLRLLGGFDAPMQRRGNDKWRMLECIIGHIPSIKGFVGASDASDWSCVGSDR